MNNTGSRTDTSDWRSGTKLLLNLVGAAPLSAFFRQNLCHRLLQKALAAQAREVQAAIISELSVGQMCFAVAFSFFSKGVNNIFLH